MPAGSICASAPGNILEAEFEGPCDFLHFYIETGYARSRAAPLNPDRDHAIEGVVVHDPLAAQLGRGLAEGRTSADPDYIECVGQMVLARLLTLRPSPSKVSPLPQWRLRRVQEFIAAHISSPITLHDLAAASGLSRMHFAAQFRAATSATPHSYLLQQRIEYAKRRMREAESPLVEVALDSGFQSQSHFSAVFKRLTGDSPARWRRLCRND
jgi:AraC-like DNA-binding protein